MKRTTYTMMFFIKRKKLLQNGEAPIYLRITVDRGKAEFAIKRSIDPQNWEQARQKVKASAENSASLNYYIDHVRNMVYEAQGQLEDKGKPVTATTLRDKAFHRYRSQELLLKYYQCHNDEMKELIGKDFSRLTWVRHNTSLRNFRKFLSDQYRKSDIPFGMLDVKMMRDYRHYLRTICQCNNNTTIKYLRNIGKIIRMAMAEELIFSNPLAGLSLKYDKVDIVRLTESELASLISQPFDNPRLDEVRDIFVFCCYTGLAFIDVAELREEHFETDRFADLWIRKKRGKTDIEFLVPVLDIAEGILRKYFNHPIVRKKRVMLPLATNQKYNDYLKVVANICGIEKKLTTHTARHTFGTLMLERGISLEVVSKMMGHSNTKITQHYAKVMEKRIRSEMDKLR